MLTCASFVQENFH